MSRTEVERVADAILYEGYLLYPYRLSSIKNRQRWTFGGVYPRVYSMAQGETEPWAMQTELLVRDGADTTLQVRVRFLHLLERLVGELAAPLSTWPEDGAPPYRLVPSLQVGEWACPTGQEAVEREINLDVRLAELVGEAEGACSSETKNKSGDASPHSKKIAFGGSRTVRPLADKEGAILGVLVRQQEAVTGEIELAGQRVGEGLVRLTMRIRNLTHLDQPHERSRDEALLRSFVSTHTILQVRDGNFVSLLDPPESYQELAGQCQNVGAWPVLVGGEGATDTMLSSPIILYDYPRVAPESPGDLFDATEIDEILTLRILTLTEDEKRDMCAGDERARGLLERTEALARDQLLGLHGAVRGLRAVRGEGQR